MDCHPARGSLGLTNRPPACSLRTAPNGPSPPPTETATSKIKLKCNGTLSSHAGDNEFHAQLQNAHNLMIHKDLYRIVAGCVNSPQYKPINYAQPMSSVAEIIRTLTPRHDLAMNAFRRSSTTNDSNKRIALRLPQLGNGRSLEMICEPADGRLGRKEDRTERNPQPEQLLTYPRITLINKQVLHLMALKIHSHLLKIIKRPWKKNSPFGTRILRITTLYNAPKPSTHSSNS